MVNKIKSIIIRLLFCLRERKFVSKHDGQSVHYIFKKNKRSDCLTVVFSGFAGHYVSGRYNYFKTLKGLNSNLLFIKDDQGYCSVGTYYFGTNCSWKKCFLVENLIHQIADKNRLELRVSIGSSKGGYSALYFGLMLKFKYIVSGSPQYQISNYLKSITDDNDFLYGTRILESIICDEFDSEYINDALFDIIKKSDAKSKIYLYYSTKEDSFKKDVSKLIVDLQDRFELELVDLKNEEHSYIGSYFQKNLNTIINKLL